MQENNMKILMVLTSHDVVGDTDRKTGFRLEALSQAVKLADKTRGYLCRARKQQS
jgi:hypothetical protein